MKSIDELANFIIEQMMISIREKDVISGFLRFLKNRSIDGRNTTYGLLVQYDKESEYKKFLQLIEYALAEMNLKNPYEMLFATEENLVKNSSRLKKEARRNRIFALIECGKEGPLDSIVEQFLDTPEMIKIVGASEDIINSRFSQNEEFRYRILPRIVHLNNTGSNEVTRLFLNEFNSIYIGSKAFEEEIGYYIDTIYDGADFQKHEFIQDLLLRIERQMEEHEGVDAYLKGEVVDESFVPFSIKVNKRKEAVSTEEAGVENLKNITEEKDTKEDTEELKETVACEILVNEAEIHQQEPQIADEPHTDIMLLAMSTFPRNKKVRKTEFTVAGNSELKIIGRSQLDPIPKYVAELLKKEGECLDKIIILATEDTLKKESIETPEKTEETISAVDYFINQVRGYLNPEGLENRKEFDSKRFVVIEANEEQPAEGIGEVLKNLRKESNVRLHMAMNGGLRGVQRMLEAMVVLLKLENIPVVGAYSTEMGKDRIINETERLKIFDFVSGMNEFYYDGRINALKPYLVEKNELTNAVAKVSEGIGWCNVQTFEEGLQELRAFYSSNQTQNDPYLALFRDSFEKDFKELLVENISVLDEIKWCRKKGFYQQALTFLEARMSKTLIDNNVISRTENGSEYSDNDLFNGLVIAFSRHQMSAEQFNAMTEDNYNNFRHYVDGTCGCQVNNLNPRTYWVSVKVDGNRVRVDRPFAFSRSSRMTEFLLLHKALKNVRNEMNHARDVFAYEKEKIELALDHYIVWAERIMN